MPFVPGYSQDVFVSYAHGDDRGWIDSLVNRLRDSINRRLGAEIALWIDDKDLRPSRNFQKDIPKEVRSSAVFLPLASPNFIKSDYCINVECQSYKETIAPKLARFKTDTFENEQFVLRTRILPIEANLQWKLFEGVSDIPFCDDSDSFAIGSPEFESSFRRLSGELLLLLKKMHNHSTPVFLYPRNPSPALQEARSVLSRELAAQNYRVLPESEIDPQAELRDSALSVFLLGEVYDDKLRPLAELASRLRKPWLVWCSRASEVQQNATLLGLSEYLEQLESLEQTKTFLDSAVTIPKLREEVLALLGPAPDTPPYLEGKPRVYLVYDRQKTAEAKRAGLIRQHFGNEAQFEFSDDPVQHSSRLIRSDGVLLVWGMAEQEWCTRQFEQMLRTSRNARSRGLCLFDPEESKRESVEELKQKGTDLCIAEQFGPRFDPARLEPFFEPLRGSGPGGAP